jgi:hypothetical protein
LTFAFASDVTRELPIAQLREHMEKFVLDWLPGGERIR